MWPTFLRGMLTFRIRQVFLELEGVSDIVSSGELCAVIEVTLAAAGPLTSSKPTCSEVFTSAHGR